MTKSEIKGFIANKVECINRMTGYQFVTDYNKQGWLLYEWKDNCPCSTNHISFTGGRLKDAEMVEYMDGVYNTLMAVKYGGLKVK
jgi:hypothetical protein